MLLFSRMNCARLTSNDKRQIDPKLGASISVRTVCLRTDKTCDTDKGQFVNFSRFRVIAQAAQAHVSRKSQR